MWQNRWALAYTLIHNPQLRSLRRSAGHSTLESCCQLCVFEACYILNSSFTAFDYFRLVPSRQQHKPRHHLYSLDKLRRQSGRCHISSPHVAVVMEACYSLPQSVYFLMQACCTPGPCACGPRGVATSLPCHLPSYLHAARGSVDISESRSRYLIFIPTHPVY